MPDSTRLVTVPCPRCGKPFVLSVGLLATGHEIDVDDYSCACDLTEDEYEEMCDQAVALAEAGQGEVWRPATPAPAPRPWWRRILGRG